MTIALDRVGSGPALVLLHPLGADRHVWAPIVERLADQRKLIAVDLPGFGESTPLEGKPTPRALAVAVAVAERLTEIGVERPHVVGNSLGGWVALELGLEGLTSSTTAIAPAGLWPRPLLPKPGVAHMLAHALLPVVGAVAGTRVGRRLLLSKAVAHPSRVPAAAATQLVRAYARAPGFVAVNNAMRAGHFPDLERVPSPVTLIWPEHDRLINRPKRLPHHVENVELTDAGHIPFWDVPDEVADVLLAASAIRPLSGSGLRG